MAKITLADLNSLQNENTAIAKINSNNQILEIMADNTLSRDGSAPNNMEAILDMDGNQIVNLPKPATANSPLRLQDLNDFEGGGTVTNIPAGGTTGQVLTKNSNTNYDVKWAAGGGGGGSGTVTSVGLSLPSDFNVSGSPVTTSGTITATYANKAANLVLAGPSSGGATTPTYRSLIGADLPLPTASTRGAIQSKAAVTNQFLTEVTTGGVVNSAQPAFTDISGQATNSQLANMPAGTVLSNVTGGSAIPSNNTVSSVLDNALGTTRGSIAYRNATVWTPLAPGTSGQVLQTNGAGADPSWTNASGSGSVTNIATAGIITGGPITTTGTIGINAAITPQGRLTCTSGTPVLSTSGSGTTMYYTPYIGNLVPIYNGTVFTPTAFTELSQLASDSTKSPAAAAANSVYDIFVWNDSGTLRATRGPAWTNDTTRSAGTALTMVNGIYLNSVSITNGPAASRGTYVGTVRTTGSVNFQFGYGTNAAGGGSAAFYIWNAYNRIQTATSVKDTTANWTYATASTWRAANNSANNSILILRGLDIDAVSGFYSCRATAGSGIGGRTAIGLDSTTTPWAGCGPTYLEVSSSPFSIVSSYTGLVGVGLHTLTALEWTSGSSMTFYGYAGSEQPFNLTATFWY